MDGKGHVHPVTAASRRRTWRRRLISTLLTLPFLAGWITAASSADVNPLIHATLDNRVADVAALLAGGADPDAHDRNRNTALIFAARDGRTAIAKLLIDGGASIDWQDGERVTPLILAAFKGHAAIAHMLIEHGADRQIRDQWGRTAADYARRRGTQDEIYRMLRAAAE